MPLYMDRHDAVSAAPEEVYNAHLLDLKVQEKYGVRYLTYWLDQLRGNVFCLVDAPSAERAAEVHRVAHGLVGSEIIPVNQNVVESFLGRLADPAGTSTDQPIADSAFRTIVFTDLEGSTAQTQKLGDRAAMEILRTHNEIVRTALRRFSGSEVKHTGDGIMASFVSASAAVESAIEIQRSFHEHNQSAPDASTRVRVGLSAGEPVREHGDLFGATVQLARRVCDYAQAGTIYTANVVRELCIGKGFEFVDRGEATLKGFEQPVRVHEVVWLSE